MNSILAGMAAMDETVDLRMDWHRIDGPVEVMEETLNAQCVPRIALSDDRLAFGADIIRSLFLGGVFTPLLDTQRQDGAP